MNKAHARLLIGLLALMWLLYVLASLLGLPLVGDLLSCGIAFLAAVPLLLSARLSGRHAFGWLSASFGCLSWGVADLVWALDAHALGVNPEESALLMFLYLMPNICFLASVMYLAFYDRRRWGSLQFAVDVVAISVSVTAFLYVSVFYSRFLGLFRNDAESIASFLSLISDMLLISFVMSLFYSMDRRRAHSFLRVAFAGVALYVVTDVSYVYALFNEFYLPNRAIDMLYMLSIATFGVLGLLNLGAPVADFTVSVKPHSPKDMINRSALLAVIALSANLIRPLNATDVLFFGSIILVHLCVSLVIRRLLQRERELEAKSREADLLEARVAERTRELRVMNQTLENLVRRDAITGQLNRKCFLEQVESWINEASGGDRVWLMIIDFDRFKSVNDTYGHDVGDQVLRIVGKRLEAVSGDRTIIARLGGDEFGVVCARQGEEDIAPLLRTIADLCEKPIPVGDFTIRLASSVGVARWPDDARTRSDLMRHADIAMYTAKKDHGGGISFFDSAINARVERDNQIDLCLRRASIASEFSVVYQPQFAIRGRELVGMEALVRWNSPELGWVPPDEFIPIAEENGTIIPLSDWIMEASLSRIGDWNRRYSKKLLLGINISPRQLDEVGFLEKLEGAIDDFGVDPEWVNLEVTERSAMKGESFIVEIFRRLASLGISSSLDDFGTGYSSLSYLKEFDIDYLKIAKPLIDGIATDPIDEQIVLAIVMMAGALKLRTLAEGVENEEQFRLLESLGCDEIQGYFLGKPASPEEFERLYLR